MRHVYFPIVTEDEKRLPCYVTSIGIQENQESKDRPKGFPDYHWIHITQGKGMLVLGNQKFLLTKNMGFFLYPGVPHHYYGVEENWETHWLTFGGHDASLLLNLVGIDYNGPFYVLDPIGLEESFQNIMETVRHSEAFRPLTSSSRLYDFLLGCKHFIGKSPSHGVVKADQLQPVLAFIHENYPLDLSLKNMADQIHVSTPYFCRLFKAQLGMRPFEYLLKIRLKKAKELLFTAPELPVKEIAICCGFHDPSYFCSLFKKAEGSSPGIFRKRHAV